MTITNLPAALQPLVLSGMLDRTLMDALRPENMWRQLATPNPFPGRVGDSIKKTRRGLMTPNANPIAAGGDPSAGSYGLEQFEVTLSRYGDGSLLTTDMIGSQTAIVSQWLQNQQALGIHAGQSLNILCRNKLYTAYRAGNTYAVGAGTGATALVVADVNGFTHLLVNGVPTPISATTPLAITIGGTAASVTAVNTGTKTLTLAVAATWTDGAAVVSSLASKVIRAGARASENAITTSDVATLSVFLDAVAHLRSNHVPTINGAYVAKIGAKTERQLFADSDFKQAYQGRGDSPEWRDLSLGRFAGLDWVRDETVSAITVGAVTVHQPIVLGADALIEAPLEGGLEQVFSAPEQQQGGVVRIIDGVAFINRAPSDPHLSRTTSSWMWLGDFAVPTDATDTVTPALYKRGVIVQHYAA